MHKKFISSAVFLLSITGSGAFAQNMPVSSTTQTTVTTTAPDGYVTDKTKTETQRTVESDGTEITKTKSFQSGNGTLNGTSRLQVTSPDGLTASVNREANRPVPLTTHETETTTIIQKN